MRAWWTARDGKRVGEQGWKVDESMKEFISGKNCRRIALDKEIDEIDGRTNCIGCEIGEERCDICKGNPRGTKRGRVVVENQGATPSKRPDAAPVNRAEGSGTISESEQEDERLEDVNGLDAEVIESEGEENNGLEGNEGAMAMWDEFTTERQRQDIIRQRRMERRAHERLGIEDLPRQFEDWKIGCVIVSVGIHALINGHEYHCMIRMRC
jgi:hypothetical protein